MKKLFVLSVLSLGLIGCTTVGQQITNSNGTVVVNQTPKTCGLSTKKFVNEPKATILPVPAPKPAPKIEPPCCEVEIEYCYQSTRVVGSYIVLY